MSVNAAKTGFRGFRILVIVFTLISAGMLVPVRYDIFHNETVNLVEIELEILSQPCSRLLKEPATGLR
jgi:hypothetical protein